MPGSADIFRRHAGDFALRARRLDLRWWRPLGAGAADSDATVALLSMPRGARSAASIMYTKGIVERLAANTAPRYPRAEQGRSVRRDTLLGRARRAVSAAASHASTSSWYRALPGDGVEGSEAPPLAMTVPFVVHGSPRRSLAAAPERWLASDVTRGSRFFLQLMTTFPMPRRSRPNPGRSSPDGSARIEHVIVRPRTSQRAIVLGEWRAGASRRFGRWPAPSWS